MAMKRKDMMMVMRMIMTGGLREEKWEREKEKPRISSFIFPHFVNLEIFLRMKLGFFSKSIVNYVRNTSSLETSLVYQLRSTWVFYDKTALGEIDGYMKLKPGSSSRIRTRAE